jgi:ATP-binding cassette subfamily C protein CydC
MQDILVAARGKTVIMATHDTRLLPLVDSVYQFEAGRLHRQSGAPINTLEPN